MDMRFTFRARILGILILLGAVPATALIIGWAITLRTLSPSGSTGLALEEIGASGRMLVETVDTTRLTPDERRAFGAQVEITNNSLGRAQRSIEYVRYYSAGLAIIILVLGTILVYASVVLAGHLARQLSRPIHELVGWTERIRLGQSLPEGPPPRGAPEFEALRNSLRDMATELESGRRRELEAERLRAFREVARRVAHEMKNPLTPIRFAVDQLKRTATVGQQEALEVLATESSRLEHLASEFTEFGRLPKGPAAEVDLHELVRELASTVVPQSTTITLALEAAPATIVGHYEPLRRALENVLRNAVEATDGEGHLTIASTRDVAGGGGIEVRVSDNGPGVPTDQQDRVFDPYVTGKANGTGLGLALVRQTVEQHHGHIRLEETPGGGATFILALVGASEPSRTSPSAAS
jgi:two-component system nitrogen regulation sensor histidine kinase NtrY